MLVELKNSLTKQQSEAMAIKHTDLAWAAGFFDGEGTVGISHQSRPNPLPVLHLSVSQNDTEVLERFKTIVGTGTIYGPYDRIPNPIYAYKTQSWVMVQYVVALLWSYLGSIKREQARVALTTFHATRHVFKIDTCVKQGHSVALIALASGKRARRCNTCRGERARASN